MSRTLKRLAQEKASYPLWLLAFTAVVHWYSLDSLILSSCYWWYIGYTVQNQSLVVISRTGIYIHWANWDQWGRVFITNPLISHLSHSCEFFSLSSLLHDCLHQSVPRSFWCLVSGREPARGEVETLTGHLNYPASGLDCQALATTKVHSLVVTNKVCWFVLHQFVLQSQVPPVRSRSW